MTRLTRSPASHVAATCHAGCSLHVETRGQGFTDLTREAAAFLKECGAREGVLTLFCRHTSASLVIQENADPSVQNDLLTALDRLAPRTFPWTHDSEGPDDMPAHIRTLLSDTSISIPVRAGCMMLGTWQGLYLLEHRDRPHRRELVLSFLGASTDLS